ncbi:MAG: hypothetical protein UX72_C0009G0020 [Parcubacteria group bacterium GW2011_GWA2_47_10]|nr:MAG: hypothetical protein UX72_C0009G0020 [Parcubacteria group bacterium GW2011_GWA2_47_10]OGZ99871.1 MAG: hypothetical protein A3D57_01630 [Candidatus Sungbacteria bacterium RIFCSPHIGHO2_02_FULL_46_12]
MAIQKVVVRKLGDKDYIARFLPEKSGMYCGGGLTEDEALGQLVRRNAKFLDLQVEIEVETIPSHF